MSLLPSMREEAKINNPIASFRAALSLRDTIDRESSYDDNPVRDGEAMARVIAREALDAWIEELDLHLLLCAEAWRRAQGESA